MFRRYSLLLRFQPIYILLPSVIDHNNNILIAKSNNIFMYESINILICESNKILISKAI